MKASICFLRVFYVNREPKTFKKLNSFTYDHSMPIFLLTMCLVLGRSGDVFSVSSGRFAYSTASSRDEYIVSSPPLSLIIFDKDGTLVDCNSIWLDWLEAHVIEIERATGLHLSSELYNTAGYCPVSEKYHSNSLLAQATVSDVQNAFKNVLVQAGIPEPTAMNIIRGCCPNFNSGNSKNLKPLGNLTHIFEELKSKNIKIAICTADSRNGTESTLENLQLSHLVDKIVCGNDETAVPKPAPDNALHICDVLQVSPNRTAVIGDTLADTRMGRNAGLGLVIGVLSGAGTKKQLESQADLILNNVDEVLGVI